MDLIDIFEAKATADPKKVVFPESNEEKILRAAREAVDRGVAYPVLLGDTKELTARARDPGISLDGMEIVDHREPAISCLTGKRPF